MKLCEVSVPPVDCVFILGHSVQSNTGVNPVGDVTEQTLPNLLRVADGDVEGLAGHHSLHRVPPQLVQLHRQQLCCPVPGIHEAVATLGTLHHLAITVLANEMALWTLVDGWSVCCVQTDWTLQGVHQLLYPGSLVPVISVLLLRHVQRRQGARRSWRFLIISTL